MVCSQVQCLGETCAALAAQHGVTFSFLNLYSSIVHEHNNHTCDHSSMMYCMCNLWLKLIDIDTVLISTLVQ